MRPPRVLVAYASRHESTAEIAAAIAGELGAAGCTVEVAEARTVATLAGVDAAIVGSALYLGRWDESALDLLRRERAALAGIPTWLFSSGPVGDGRATARPERLPQPEEVAALAGVDAAIVGSALYLGRWDESALDLLRREQAALTRIPTWLFSSGPVGDGKATARPERLPQPEEVAALASEIGAHTTTFGGRVDPDEEGFDLQIMASAGLAGDWRDFGRIRAWSRGIAANVLARADAAVGAEAHNELA